MSSYRGEGFNLPVLEAMACGLPVVVTSGGATDDFCDSLTGWKIDSAPTAVGDQIYGMKTQKEAYLLEPSRRHLQSILKSVYLNPGEVEKKGAQSRIKAENWTWDRSVDVILGELQTISGVDLR